MDDTLVLDLFLQTESSIEWLSANYASTPLLLHSKVFIPELADIKPKTYKIETQGSYTDKPVIQTQTAQPTICLKLSAQGTSIEYNLRKSESAYQVLSVVVTHNGYTLECYSDEAIFNRCSTALLLRVSQKG